MRQGELLRPLPVAEAAWFLSRHETTTLVAADGRRFVLDYTLERLEALLDPAQFLRLNRQIVAHLPAVRRRPPHFNDKLLVERHPAAPSEGRVSRARQRRESLAGGVAFCVPCCHNNRRRYGCY